MVIRIAPIAIACFMFILAALFGLDLLVRLSAYVGVVLLALGVQMIVVFSVLLVMLAKKSPLLFFRQVQEAMVMAFATASSNATLPTALRVADKELKLPPKVARRSEEHTSELQSLMRISYAVFCLQKKNTKQTITRTYTTMSQT